MPPGSITIAGTAADQGGGMVYITPVVITGTTTSYIVSQTINLVLASSDNTVAVSTAGTAMLIQPSAGIGASLVIKSSVGASGFPISNANPTVISFTSVFPNSTTGFVVSAGTSAGSTTLGEIQIRVV
jgi:hypothetical protein